MSPISSFEMNKVKIFPVLSAPRSFISLSNLFKRYEVKTARSNNTFLSKSPNVLPRNLPMNCLGQQRFTNFYIRQHIVSKGVFFLVFCLSVKNNS